MKNLKFLPILLALMIIVSCSDQEPIIEYVTVTETVVETITETVKVEENQYSDSTLEGNITSNLTLDASKMWLLKGRVSVVAGVTLTIPAGTIIKASAGTGADASSLIISRGAKIEANGTEEAPIVMTQASKSI